jgi:ABC-type transport system involved in multi-copper enzyme maturation permease subunit
MLWRKYWLETQSRFWSGLALLCVVAAGSVLGYPMVRELAPLLQGLELEGQVGARIRESLELQSTFRGFIWLRWYRDNLAQLGILFAIILGSGSIVSHAAGRGALFTLSLPVSRNRLLGVRAGLGLAQWLAVVLVSSLMIPAFSPLIGERYALGDTLVHSLSLFTVGSIYFGLALLLSTVFNDLWRPLLITICASVVVAGAEYLLRTAWPLGLNRVLSAQSWFLGGELPWLGLLVCTLTTVALLYAAAATFRRRDF